MRELTWATPANSQTYRYTKKLNKNLGHAVDAMLEFQPLLALDYASRCHNDAILQHDEDLARLCSATASAFADAAGRPDIGLYWTNQARYGGGSRPIFSRLDGYLENNASAIALFGGNKPVLRAPSISFPSTSSMKLHIKTLRLPLKSREVVKLPAINVTGGGREVSFFIDSGASSFLSTRAAKSIGFSSFGWKIHVNTLDQCSAYLVRGQLGAVSIGDVHVANMAIWRSDNSCINYPEVNILGYDFLYKMRKLFIDYEKMSVMMGSGLTRRGVGMEDATCMELGFRFSPILVEGNIAILGNVRGTNLSVMPDLGNNIGVLLSPLAYRRLISKGVVESGFKIGQKISLPLSLGGKIFTVDAIVRDNPIGVDMILPRGFFRKWYFDYKGGVLCGSS